MFIIVISSVYLDLAVISLSSSLFFYHTSFWSHKLKSIYTLFDRRRRWIPDTIPLLKPNKSKVVQSPSQENLRAVIKACLKVGLNHFETARFYGSSECQFVDALAGLVEDGTVKREDFIFQTKLMLNATKEEFEKQWDATW